MIPENNPTKRINIFEELSRVRADAIQEKRLREAWQSKALKLEKELKEVKALLAQLLNANTPSSKLPPRFKPSFHERPEKGSVPKGKPEGSHGATRETPEKVDRKIQLTCPKKCPDCGHGLYLEKYKWHVYDMKPIEFVVTEVTSVEGYCKNCQTIHCGTHPDIPIKGTIGPTLEAFVTELKHNFAGSYDKISSFIEEISGNSFSHTAINDTIGRVAGKLESSYNEMRLKLPNTQFSHSDETSWPVEGKNYYLLLFVTANFTFLSIKNSRARRVLTDFFGEYYQGVIISDCLSVYQQFAQAFQKDWVHLLRKTHFERDKYPKRNICRLHQELADIYEEIVQFQESNPSFEKRVWHSIMYHQKLQRLTQYRWSYPAKQVIDDWLIKCAGQWLVPIIMPEIPLTNNINERGIRKVIPSRKLLGGHRTEKGAKNFAIIESHRQTWKQNRESPYIALIKKLKECNLVADA